MWGCFEPTMLEVCGNWRVGPAPRRSNTECATDCCSSAVRESHHLPNSSVNSTSYATYGICHRWNNKVKRMGRGDFHGRRPGFCQQPTTNNQQPSFLVAARRLELRTYGL